MSRYRDENEESEHTNQSAGNMHPSAIPSTRASALGSFVLSEHGSRDVAVGALAGSVALESPADMQQNEANRGNQVSAPDFLQALRRQVTDSERVLA